VRLPALYFPKEVKRIYKSRRSLSDQKRLRLNQKTEKKRKAVYNKLMALDRFGDKIRGLNLNSGRLSIIIRTNNRSERILRELKI